LAARGVRRARGEDKSLGDDGQRHWTSGDQPPADGVDAEVEPLEGSRGQQHEIARIPKDDVVDIVFGVEPKAISPTELVDNLAALGVRSGEVLLVHTSYRAVRPVEAGPQGVVEALLRAVGRNGTIVMPSWSDDADTPFHAQSPAAKDLGVVADTFWRQTGAVRSSHPFAFAAVGPEAERILSDPLPLPPHRRESPVGRVWEMDGQILLLGVGHDGNTTIHLAEVMAEVPYGVPKHVMDVRDGSPVRIDYLENDHCCQRFALADDWLRARGLQREGRVGNAHARLVRSRDVVEVVVAELRKEPTVFLHPRGSGCEECDEAWRSTVGAATPPSRTFSHHDDRVVG
jgi:aminoglycoside N3'-acetyltransferase